MCVVWHFFVRMYICENKLGSKCVKVGGSNFKVLVLKIFKQNLVCVEERC